MDEALSTGRIGGVGEDVGESLSVLGVDDDSEKELKMLLLLLEDVDEVDDDGAVLFLNGVFLVFIFNLSGVYSGDVGIVGRILDAFEYVVGDNSGDSMDLVDTLLLVGLLNEEVWCQCFQTPLDL